MSVMSEPTNSASNVAQAVSRSAWRSDTAALTLRVFILACAVAGATTTLTGLQQAWGNGAPASGWFNPLMQQIWGVTPYFLLLALSLRRVSKRSLATLLVTTLLAWFMSTGYHDLDELDLGAGVIPLIQLAFIAGALVVMFTFWLLRRDTRI